MAWLVTCYSQCCSNSSVTNALGAFEPELDLSSVRLDKLTSALAGYPFGSRIWLFARGDKREDR